MSFAVAVLDAITVTPDIPKPPAGTTVELTVDLGTKEVAITDSATTAENPVTLKLSNQFVKAADVIIAIVATQNVNLFIDGQDLSKGLSSLNSVKITVGKDEKGNFLNIGGLVIRGSTARGLTISLAGGYAKDVQVAPKDIPNAFRKIFKFLSRQSFLSNAIESSTPVLNTATELSLGDDSFLGTEFNDGVVLSKGKDSIVGGGGTDIFVADSSIKGAKTKLTLEGTGSNDAASGQGDQLVLAKGALKSGSAKIVISDFNAKEDLVVLQTKRSAVRGIGTDELKISTKNGKTISIESYGTKFKRSSIDFI